MVERCCQPCVLTMPRSQSTPTTSRSPSQLIASCNRSALVTAAVPMTVQRIFVPATNAQALLVAHAAAVLHGDRDSVDDAIDDLEVDELAAARGVEIDDMQHVGSLSCHSWASATGSPEKTVAWLKSPRRRRTASPPWMSIAGNSLTAGSSPRRRTR